MFAALISAANVKVMPNGVFSSLPKYYTGSQKAVGFASTGSYLTSAIVFFFFFFRTAYHLLYYALWLQFTLCVFGFTHLSFWSEEGLGLALEAFC